MPDVQHISLPKIIYMQKILFQLIVTILIISINPNISQAQCSVTKDDSNPENIKFITKNEQFFQNRDLENGVKTVYAQSAILISKNDKNKVKFFIIVTYVGTGYQPKIVPREITFSFTDGEIRTFTAEEYDTPNINGFEGERCYFNLSVADMEMVKANSISKFTIFDNRTTKNIVTTPYSAIFQEQIKCLIKRQSEL